MRATGRLLGFAADPPAPPPAVGAALELLVRDTLAVGAAGASAPGAEGVLAAARRWGGLGPVPILGGKERLPAAGAAFVNAFQIHALEWDAVHEGAVVHALSVVTAVVHALARTRGGVGADELRTALLVGVEIACALGVAATGPMRFFRPATAGVLGAALAGARVAGLASGRLADVLGLAYSFAGGTMQAHLEGSIALPLQVAHAARAAVSAVELVAAGLAGPADPLEGPFGYFRLFEEGALEPVAETLGQRWRTAEIAFKPWPCGRASHATLGALLGETGGSVAAITVAAPPLVRRLVDRPWVAGMSTATARLCLPFLVGLMLRDGRIDPRCFTPEAFADEGLRQLGERLAVVDSGNPDPNALGPQRVVLTRPDGSVEERAVMLVPGSPGHPANDRLWAAKLALVAELTGGAVATDLIAEMTG
ncbi:MmgE/PrpD family protein [Thermaurantiacus sp.]